MEIFIEKKNKTIKKNIIEKTKISEILKKLNITPSSIIISKNNNIVLENEEVSNNDKLELLSVVSGG